MGDGADQMERLRENKPWSGCGASDGDVAAEG
jgi:hypothetical protein